jgi:hypothetical protein
MKETLKLALESLEKSIDNFPASVQHKNAIAAIKAALAQPAQEPVAWLDEEKKIIYWHNTHETDDYHGFRRTTPLYTTPPAQQCLDCGSNNIGIPATYDSLIASVQTPSENT